MNKILKHITALIVIAFVLCPLGHLVFAENSDEGSFYLVACTEYDMLIEPVAIHYSEGQSIKDALLESAYTFEGLAERNYIETINGVYGNYSVFYDSNGFDLSVSADSITALCITESFESYSPELIALIICLGQFNEMSGGVRIYAASDYSNALRGVQQGVSGEQAKILMDGLNAAIESYDELINSDKYNVTFNVIKQDGEAADNYSIKLTDSYGNESHSNTAQIEVVAGSYDFEVISGFNRTEGKVIVDGEMSVSVTLPSDEWFGNVRVMYNGDYVECIQNNADHNAVFYVSDAANEVSTKGITLYPALGRGVPDRENTVLYKMYTNTQGESIDSQVSWGSTANSLVGLLENSMIGNSVILEARYVDSNGYKMIQSYYLDFIRIPTLSVLQLKDIHGVKYLSDFSPENQSYSLTVPVGEYEVIGIPYGSDGYTVYVNENQVDSNVMIIEGVNSINVAVCHENGQSRIYTMTVIGKEPSKVDFILPEQVYLDVFTMAGSRMNPSADGSYVLVPGNDYYYIATKDEYYKTSERFTASEGISTISVAEPDNQDALENLAFYNLSSATMRVKYIPDKDFSSSVHEYMYVVEDTSSSLYAQATILEESGYTVYARYNQQHPYGTGLRSVRLNYNVSDNGKADSLTSVLMSSGYSQTITISLEKTENGVTYSQEYIVKIARKVQLRQMIPKLNGSVLLLYDADGTSLASFDREIVSYCVKVSRFTENISIAGTCTNENLNQLYGGGYSVEIGGQIYNDISEGIWVELDPAKTEESITITVLHKDDLSVSTTYTIIIKKFEPTPVSFSVYPQDSTVFIVDNVTEKPLFPQNGMYAMEPGRSYTYTVTKNGYVGKTGEYTATLSAETVYVTLDIVAENTGLILVNAEWPYFRADKDNNGVVNYNTPTIAEDTVLYWANQIGIGSGSQACGCPIIVDGYLYVYASTKIYKVDTISGNIVATGVMDRASSFAINSPAYAEGMLFVGLSNGGVQAFNADTLESLWIYNDRIKAQPNCPIVYHDGYIYTGFWKGEINDASFVCLSVTDEDPSNTLEEKLATWRHVQKGGFYWAGAYVCDDFVLVGTDDGDTGYIKGHAEVLSFKPKTGEIISRITLPYVGDLRSSITHDTATGDYYFTTKGGYLYRLSVTSDGAIIEDSLRYVKLDNYKEDQNNPPMSTCTPVIYNGRAYVGVSGTSQFGQYSGHNITVIDLNSMRIAYKVRTQGYPQTSGLLTTAYDEGDGTVYIYFVDNMTPGKLRVISDRPGQYEPKELTQEVFTDKTGTHVYDTAYVLFTPVDEQAEFAICSPIADETGTIYFKNDSGCLMAIGPTIDRLEITTMPDKTSYEIGESFDPAGMKVTAYYSNGTSRDVTNYVTYSKDALGADDTEFEIRFDYVMYQNIGDEAGVIYDAPSVILDLTIGTSTTALLGDINGDGTVNATDVSEFISLIARDEAPEIALGDINGDGTVNATDVSELIQRIAGY